MVTYRDSHLLLRGVGTFGTSAADVLEEFSFGMRIFIGPNNHTEAAKNAFLTAVAPRWSTFYAVTTNGCHGSSWLKELTAAYIGTDGHYEGGNSQSTTRHVYATPVKGGGGRDVPYSCALAVTLRTDLDRGRGSHGRFYLPCGFVVDLDGRYGVSDVDNVRVNVMSALNNTNLDARNQWSPASAISVYSGVGTLEVGTVTEVSVGRSPDTQRRRDKKLDDEHSYFDLSSTLFAKQALDDRVYS